MEGDNDGWLILNKQINAPAGKERFALIPSPKKQAVRVPVTAPPPGAPDVIRGVGEALLPAHLGHKQKGISAISRYVKEKPRDILNRWRSSAIQELMQKGEVVEAAKVLDIMKDYRTVEERERTSTSTTSLPNLPSTKNLGGSM